MDGVIRTVLLAALALPFAAQADDLRPPAGAPKAFQSECAGCHIAFPPQLLSALEWRRIMANLDRHYGDDASLDEPTRRVIEEFLARNAGSDRRFGPTGKSPRQSLPRLTETDWFTRKHDEVPRRTWSHPQVKTPSNCAACHTRAEDGSYREREIVLPGGRRWKD